MTKNDNGNSNILFWVLIIFFFFVLFGTGIGCGYGVSCGRNGDRYSPPISNLPSGCGVSGKSYQSCAKKWFCSQSPNCKNGVWSKETFVTTGDTCPQYELQADGHTYVPMEQPESNDI